MEIKGLWPRVTGAAVVAALAVAPAAVATGGPPPHAQNEHAAKSQAAKPEPKAHPAPPATPPGQAKKEQRAAEPAKAAKPAKPAKAKSAPAKAKGAPAQRSGGGRRKVTICHATGSDTNPYVTITVAEPAVRAHSRHQDGRDIVPAPAGGCPKGEAPKQAAVAKREASESKTKSKSKTTICHATGSDSNPYVTITLPEPAVRAHARHQDGRDIIPAPAGGCPTPDPAKVAAQSIERALGVVGGSSAKVPPIGMSSMLASGGPEKDARAVAARSDSRSGEQDTLGVIGEIESGGGSGGEALPAAEATRAGDDGGSLPFTGLQVALLALLGAGALLTGIALLRASRMTWSRPTSG